MTRILDPQTRLDAGACRYCGRTVLWVTGPTGGRFTVDHTPDPDGTFTITRGPDRQLMSREPGEGDVRYREHDCRGLAA